MSKWNSRKLWLMTSLFIMAQILKWQNKIGDWPWLAASIIGTFGYAALVLYFRNKNKELDRG